MTFFQATDQRDSDFRRVTINTISPNSKWALGLDHIGAPFTVSLEFLPPGISGPLVGQVWYIERKGSKWLLAYAEGGYPGDQGDPGPPGPSGSVWYTGEGPPDPGLGANRDYYLDTRTGDVWGPKNSGGWGAEPAFSLQGPEGEQGEPGRDGGSDGIPPEYSPIPSLLNGIGYIYAHWIAVPNADIVTYEVHVGQSSGFAISDSSLIGETRGTFFFIKNWPDGTALDYGETVWVRLVAKDADGDADVSIAVSGNPNRVTDGDLGSIDFSVHTDGNPPTLSPDPVVTPGIRSLYVSWETISNRDPVLYEVHISDTDSFTPDSNTLSVVTSNTQAIVRKVGGGLGGGLLLYETEYYIQIIAKDGDGSAPPSNESSSEVLKVDTIDIFDGAVGESQLGDKAVTINKLAVIMGGGNLVYNSSFLSWETSPVIVPTYWALGDDAYVSEQPGRRAGAPSVRFVGTTGLNNGENRISFTEDVFEPSTTYTVSFYARRVTGTGKLFFGIENDDDKVVEFDDVSGNWIRVSGTVTTGPTSGAKGYFWNNSANNTFDISDVQVEEGDVLTAWSPRVNELLPGTILGEHLVANTITGDKIAANTITATQMQAGTITAASGIINDLSASVITSGTIDADIVSVINLDASQITAGVLSASRIAAESLSADKLASGTIDSQQIDLVGVNGSIRGNYAAGLSGFIIRGDGSAEFNDGVFRGNVAGGTIDIGGFDSTSFHVDAAGNMWLGHANYASAPFRVSSTGSLYASTGTFAGSLNGATGTFSGSLNAATGTFSGTLLAGSVNAGTITGSTYRSAAFGRRVEIGPNLQHSQPHEIAFYNNNGTLGGVIYGYPSGSGISIWGGLQTTSLSVIGPIVAAGGTFSYDLSAQNFYGQNLTLTGAGAGHITCGTVTSLGKVRASDYEATAMNTSSTAGQALHHFLNGGIGDIYRYTSSIKAKKNVRDVELIGYRDPIEVLRDLRPVYYDVKDDDPVSERLKSLDSTWTPQEGIQKNILGFIAEEVEALIPQLATRDGNGVADGIQDRAMLAFLVKVCQLLSIKIDVLEKAQLTVRK